MTHPLEQITIASPCQADWNAMTGNEQVRFCQQCQLNVYNLSGMTHTDAEDLIQSKEGRLCVRFYQRHDGTVITRDCPVGIKALHRRKVKRLGAVAAALTLITAAGAFFATASAERKPTAAPTNLNATMGDVATPMMGAPSITPTQGNLVAPPEAVSPKVPQKALRKKGIRKDIHKDKACKLPKQPKQFQQPHPPSGNIQQIPPVIMGKMVAPRDIANPPKELPGNSVTPAPREKNSPHP